MKGYIANKYNKPKDFSIPMFPKVTIEYNGKLTIFRTNLSTIGNRWGLSLNGYWSITRKTFWDIFKLFIKVWFSGRKYIPEPEVRVKLFERPSSCTFISDSSKKYIETDYNKVNDRINNPLKFQKTTKHPDIIGKDGKPEMWNIFTTEYIGDDSPTVSEVMRDSQIIYCPEDIDLPKLNSSLR